MLKKESCVENKKSKDARYRANQKKKGLKLFRVWIPEEYVSDLSEKTRQIFKDIERKIDDI
jgi:hypothetical protein